jgi:hypothetical protein
MVEYDCRRRSRHAVAFAEKPDSGLVSSNPRAPRRVQRSPAQINERFDLKIEPLRLHLADDPYTDIEGVKVHQYLLDVVEFSEQSRRDGAKMWGRIAGMKYDV